MGKRGATAIWISLICRASVSIPSIVSRPYKWRKRWPRVLGSRKEPDINSTRKISAGVLLKNRETRPLFSSSTSSTEALNLNHHPQLEIDPQSNNPFDLDLSIPLCKVSSHVALGILSKILFHIIGYHLPTMFLLVSYHRNLYLYVCLRPCLILWWRMLWMKNCRHLRKWHIEINNLKGNKPWDASGGLHWNIVQMDHWEV